MKRTHLNRPLRSTAGCVLLGATAVLLAACCPPVDEPAAPQVERVAVPDGVFLPAGHGVAFRVAGEEGEWVRGAQLPPPADADAETDADSSADTTAGLLLFSESNGRYRLVETRRQGDSLIADLKAGKTYVLAPRAAGWVGTTLTALCRLKWPELERPGDDLPGICTRILCANDLVPMASLPEPERFFPGGEPGPIELGGWDVVPRDLCDMCTRPRAWDGSIGVPTYECMLPPGPCGGGDVLFHDDFEADLVGGPPALAPAGAPPDDRLEISGDVTVVAATSKAASVVRQPSGSVLTAVLGDGADSTGSYCIRFTGRSVGWAGAPAVVTLRDVDDRVAWHLVVGEDQVEILSGGANEIAAGDFTSDHTYRFDVDLDLGVFDVYLDGAAVASGLSFLDPGFEQPDRLDHAIGDCMLECNPSEWTVDDVAVTKR